jgi:hypothetical protein
MTAEIDSIFITFYNALSAAQIKKFTIQEPLQMGNEEGPWNEPCTFTYHIKTFLIRKENKTRCQCLGPYHSPNSYFVFTKITNKMQLCRIIYCSSTALHVSSDIFTHNQEHLNCNYSFWFYSCVLLSSANSQQRHTWIKPEALITVKMLLIMSENITRNM